MNFEPRNIHELRTPNYELGGFSLAETLIALGILAIGMLLIAGVFPVAIRLTTISAERTTAAVVAEEAFAKVQLYAKGNPTQNTPGNDDIDLNKLSDTELIDFNNPSKDAFPAIKGPGQYEFIYPSMGPVNVPNAQYCWSVLCRLTGTYSATLNPNPPVQVTVFVCRKAGRASKYHQPFDIDGTIDSSKQSDWPRPVKIKNVTSVNNNQLQLPSADRNLVNDDYTIVDNASGQIYRVVRRLPVPNDDRIQLDRALPTINPPTEIWVVPPAIGGGRNPCIAVYQKEILF